MILTGDYHTHTPYSHGKQTVAENAEQAKKLGLRQIGVSDHGFAHITYGIRRRQVAAYRAECVAAAKSLGIDVLVGIEANICGTDGQVDMRPSDYENFDIFLCGKHVFVRYANWRDLFGYGFGNLGQGKARNTPSERLRARNTAAYIAAIKKNPIDAITHLGYCCPANVLEVAKCAADYGTYIELNSKKQHLTDEELSEIVAKTSARFIVDSDAHSAERVGDKVSVEAQLSRVGFPTERIDNADGRYPRFRFAEYKKKL